MTAEIPPNRIESYRAAGVYDNAPKIGARVRVNGLCPYFHDWRNAVLTVVAVRVVKDQPEKLDIAVVDADRIQDGWTDGFSPEELSPIT